jgi:hypothetical protein
MPLPGMVAVPAKAGYGAQLHTVTYLPPEQRCISHSWSWSEAAWRYLSREVGGTDAQARNEASIDHGAKNGAKDLQHSMSSLLIPGA